MSGNSTGRADLAAGFRQSMRRLATTVSIVAAGSPGDWRGMAATAVTSVTADPPTILVSVNLHSSILPAVGEDGLFSVNLLADRHHRLVDAFGGGLKGMERFSVGCWREGPSGIPILEDAASTLVCRLSASWVVETHRLLIGRIVDIVNHDEIAPLLWVDGRLAQCAALEAATE